LSWEPEVAAISASGDMGYTTGPFEFRAKGKSDTVSRAGHYVTVWKRDSTGTWKMALDIGTSHRHVPRPSDAEGSVIAIAAPLGSDARQAIIGRDSVLGKTGGAPQRDVLLPAMAPDARLHREGAVPALGIDAVRAELNGDDRPYHAKPLGAGASRAGDFGYSYGEYELVATFTRPAERGFYLRLWRPGADGTWQIILDLAQPARRAG
jgi:ketosteroid isomerase-like protein